MKIFSIISAAILAALASAFRRFDGGTVAMSNDRGLPVMQISNDLSSEMDVFGNGPTRSNRIYAAGNNDPSQLGFNGPNMSAEERAQSNDANFEAGHLSEPLTQFVSRISDEDGFEEELDSMAPPVPVGRTSAI